MRRAWLRPVVGTAPILLILCIAIDAVRLLHRMHNLPHGTVPQCNQQCLVQACAYAPKGGWLPMGDNTQSTCLACNNMLGMT